MFFIKFQEYLEKMYSCSGAFKAGKLKPYPFNFAIKRSWFRQSNVLQRSVTKAPNTLDFIDLFYFSNKAKRHCSVPNLFLKPYWYFEKISSKKYFSQIKLEVYLLAYSFFLSFYYTFFVNTLANDVWKYIWLFLDKFSWYILILRCFI